MLLCTGALQLAELLQSPALRRLRHLDLSCNKLTDLGSTFTGVGALATALKKNRVLTSLNLARNSLFKNGACGMLGLDLVHVGRGPRSADICPIVVRALVQVPSPWHAR